MSSYKNFSVFYDLFTYNVNYKKRTKYLLKLIGVENPSLAFEKEAMDAYNKRYEDFLDKIPVKPEKYKKM